METFGGLDFRVMVSLMRRGYKRKLNLETKKKKKKRSLQKSRVIFWRWRFPGDSKRRRERKLGEFDKALLCIYCVARRDVPFS